VKLGDGGYLITKSTLDLETGQQNFDNNTVQFITNPHLKSPDNIHQELPLEFEADFDVIDGLTKFKEGTNRDSEETEDLDQADLEEDQVSTTSEEEEDDEAPDEPRKPRNKSGLREQEKELSEFYQLVCPECKTKWTSFSALSSHCKKVHECRPLVNCHCGKSFNRRSHLIRHRNLHLGVHRYKLVFFTLYFCR